MRRRRHQLQVSTFPFLAVLLCAMGSLILLLLVIDRRTKEAAREKALRAYRQVTARQEQQEAARRAELERQSQELHARLQHANEKVLTQVQASEADVQAAQQRLDAARRQYHAVRAQMALMADRLSHDQAQLGQGQAEVLRAAQVAETNRKALAQLEAELRQLEQTVIDLKLARERQTRTYSLMPYRGRQGDNRRPLYVECTAGGYIFHPDRLHMRLTQVRLADLRTEVQHRLDHLRDIATGDAKKPYVLLLVRPDGIESYYVLMRALDGLKLDFGYEFVERDWVLDFQDENVLGNQPWMAEAAPAAPARSDLKPLDLGRRNHANLGGAFTFGSAGSGVSGADQKAPGGAGHGSNGGGGGTNMAGNPGGGTSSGHGLAEAGGGRSFATLGVPIGSVSGHGGKQGVPGTAASAAGGPRAALGGGASGNPGNRLASGSSGTSRTGQRDNAGSDATALTATGQPIGPPSGRASSSGNGPPPRPGVDGSGVGSSTPTASAQTGTVGGQPGAGPPGESTAGVASATQAQPAATASVGQAQPAAGAASAGQAQPAAGSRPEGDAAAGGADATQGSAMLARPDPLAGIAPGHDKPRPRRPVIRPAMLQANRDWIIGLECRGQEIILHPGQKSFAVVGLEDGSTAEPLASTLRDLITRRQASVLPGQPPYRPLLRFLVWPNGLRGYYDAYPLLEGLRVPMGRVDIHSNDELRRALYPGA